MHSRTFYLASTLLPAQKRRAMRALYAFCRVSDDLVDAIGEGRARQAHFEEWCERALSNLPPADDPVALAWADTRLRYRIPAVYAQQLLEGVARDMQATRYATFEELAVYCYGVASTVGLMAMHIMGFSGPQAMPYAIRLGVAMQLTNILRDVGEDWQAGRLYLPVDELACFGLDEQYISRGRVDGRWKAFMRFQITRTRRLYTEAWPGIGMLHPDARFAVGAAATLYEDILKDIEAHDMDVFNRRARVSTDRKLCLLPGIWYRVRFRR
jgi:phytoene synthase